MKTRNKKIYVTRPDLPPLPELFSSLEKIWEKHWVTNFGEYHDQLENDLCKFLNVKYLSLFANGTLALMTALKVLKIDREVITTPYSFVATSNALLWNNIKPVFVDTDPVFGNIDPYKIEEAITSDTTGILPVHVYGNPCDVERIQSIAEKNNLKLIYDAAHAFGVKHNNQSILNFGHLSVLSFHATKVFNTIEGGAIICHDESTKRAIDDLKNFGFRNEDTIIAPGINGKLNELQSAVGIINLKYYPENRIKRKKIAESYRSQLNGIRGIRFLPKLENAQSNYSYFPIFVDHDFYINRDELFKRLKAQGINTRKYFYPLISDLPMYRDYPSANEESLTNASLLASQVLCLPLYSELSIQNTENICLFIKNLR